MKRNSIRTLIALVLAAHISILSAETLPNARLADPPKRPPGFVPPPLNPTGIKLEKRELADGVYALMSNADFADNTGFIVGENAVLVIDSHFNGRMARQIIDAVRETTDLPIKYLLNTNAFGDHVFGNYLFPQTTRIIAYQGTIDALKISSVRGIAQTMAGTVNGDLSVFDGVELRVPDEGFETFWSVDLGGKIVEMHWLGTGMSPNDSVVFLPEERIAWTANLVFGAGTIPWARSNGIRAYRETIRELARTLKPLQIVPGHGAIVSGESLRIYEEYLSDVLRSAEKAQASNTTISALSDGAEIDEKFDIAPNLEGLMTGFHRWNLRVAFHEVEAQK